MAKTGKKIDGTNGTPDCSDAPVVDSKADGSQNQQADDARNVPHGWRAFDLIERTEITFKNPMGRSVTVVAEVRCPEGRDFLRVIVGRADPESPTGVSRYCFFDDAPYLLEAPSDVYQKTLPKYVALEEARIESARKRNLAALKDRIDSAAPNSWVGRLRDIKKDLPEGADSE